MVRIMGQIDQKKDRIQSRLLHAVLSITIVSLGCLLIVYSSGCGAITTPSLPDPAEFKDGDIIWPKKPGTMVPYFTAGDTGVYEDSKKRWEDEKEKFIQSIRDNPNVSDYERKAAEQLEKTSFEEFMALYFGEGADWRAYAFNYHGDSTELRQYGFDFPLPIHIGHVGMIFIKNGVPWVVDAVLPWVRIVSYADWLKQYQGASVWHGRFKNLNPENNYEEIVKKACEQKDRPYSLFNRNLDDEREFYCSKLIWFSVFKVTGIALDGDSNPERLFWYTPKQLMNSEEHIKMIHNPGDY